MAEIFFTFHYKPRTLAAVLLIIGLCIADSYLTLYLVSCGAQELNPLLAYCIHKSPLLFFVVKYSLTSAAVIIILIVKDKYIWGTRIRAGFLLVFFFFVLALVIQWELFLIYQVMD